MTKLSTLLLTAALAAGAAGAATAQSAARLASPSEALINDVYVRGNAASTRVDLGTIRTAAPGTVEVFNHRGGEPGELIVAQALEAGVNRDVRLALDAPRRHDLLLVVTVGGQVVHSEVVNIQSGVVGMDTEFTS